MRAKEKAVKETEQLWQELLHLIGNKSGQRMLVAKGSSKRLELLGQSKNISL